MGTKTIDLIEFAGAWKDFDALPGHGRILMQKE
jgi:hypothetical protein